MTDTELLIQLAKLDGCEYCKNRKVVYQVNLSTDNLLFESCIYEKDCRCGSKFELDRNKLYAELNLQEVLNKV